MWLHVKRGALIKFTVKLITHMGEYHRLTCCNQSDETLPSPLLLFLLIIQYIISILIHNAIKIYKMNEYINQILIDTYHPMIY